MVWGHLTAAILSPYFVDKSRSRRSNSELSLLFHANGMIPISTVSSIFENVWKF